MYVDALINKQKYCPKNINEDGIKAHFKDKEIDRVDAMKGSIDGVRVDVHCFKELEYVMMLI